MLIIRVLNRLCITLREWLVIVQLGLPVMYHPARLVIRSLPLGQLSVLGLFSDMVKRTVLSLCVNFGDRKN